MIRVMSYDKNNENSTIRESQYNILKYIRTIFTAFFKNTIKQFVLKITITQLNILIIREL